MFKNYYIRQRNLVLILVATRLSVANIDFHSSLNMFDEFARVHDYVYSADLTILLFGTGQTNIP